MGKTSIFSTLGNTEFRKLWIAQITSQIALNMLIFVLGISVYEETKSNAAVSFLLLSFNIPSVIFGVFAGGIVDYFEKKKLLVFCNLSRFLLLVCFTAYYKNFVVLIILSILISVISQLFVPVEGPSIAEILPGNQLLGANSLFSISYYLSTITGFIIAGPAIEHMGYRLTYVFMSLLLFIATVSVVRMKKISRNISGLNNFKFSQLGQTVDEGLRFIKARTRVFKSLILLTFAQALVVTLTVLAPGFADKILTIKLTDASFMVMGPAALGMVAGSLIIGNYGYRFLKGAIILSGIIFSGIILTLLSFITRSTAQSFLGVNNLTMAVILLFLLGAFNSFITVPANTLLQSESDREMRGRVYGVLTSLTGGVSFIPVIFSGMIADVFGISFTLAVIGLVVLLLGTFEYIKKIKVSI